MKYFNTFMYDRTLHYRRTHFCCYCLQAFSTEEILKFHANECFRINWKQMIKMPKKGEYVRLKSYKSRIKSPFIMIFVACESILMPEENAKQNPDESYTNKY